MFSNERLPLFWEFATADDKRCQHFRFEHPHYLEGGPGWPRLTQQWEMTHSLTHSLNPFLISKHCETYWPSDWPMASYTLRVSGVMWVVFLVLSQGAGVAKPWPLHDDCVDACSFRNHKQKKKRKGWLAKVGLQPGRFQTTDSQATRYG